MGMISPEVSVLYDVHLFTDADIVTTLHSIIFRAGYM